MNEELAAIPCHIFMGRIHPLSVSYDLIYSLEDLDFGKMIEGILAIQMLFFRSGRRSFS